MIAVAQLLKLSADQSYITSLIDKVETKIDSKFAEPQHPQVMSAM